MGLRFCTHNKSVKKATTFFPVLGLLEEQSLVPAHKARSNWKMWPFVGYRTSFGNYLIYYPICIQKNPRLVAHFQ
jgi:hypothetical protein